MKSYLLLFGVLLLIFGVQVTLGIASVYSGIGSDFYVGQAYENKSFVNSTIMAIDTQYDPHNLVVGGVMSTKQCQNCSFLYFVEKDEIKWRVQFKNWKIGAVAFEGSSVVAVVLVQNNQTLQYTESILVIENASTKTDSTAQPDLYQLSYANYQYDSFPIALLPLSSQNYVIVYQDGIIRQVAIKRSHEQGQGYSEFKQDNLKFLDAKSFTVLGDSDEGESTYLTALALNSSNPILQIFTLKLNQVRTLISFNLTDFNFNNPIDKETFDGRLDTYTDTLKQTTFYIILCNPNKYESVSIIKILYKVGNSSYSVENLLLANFNYGYQVLAINESQALFLISHRKYDSTLKYYTPTDLKLNLTQVDFTTVQNQSAKNYQITNSEFILGLNVSSIQAIIYKNLQTYSSYIFGTSIGFDSTAQNQFNNSFCGYVIKYDETDQTVKSNNTHNASYSNNTFSRNVSDVNSYQDGIINPISQTDSSYYIQSPDSWSYLSDSVPNYTTKASDQLVVVLNLAPEFPTLYSKLLFSQCNLTAEVQICSHFYLPNITDFEGNLPLSFIVEYQDLNSLYDNYFLISEVNENSQTRYQVENLKYQPNYSQYYIDGAKINLNFCTVFVTPIDSFGIVGEKTQFQFVFSDQISLATLIDENQSKIQYNQPQKVLNSDRVESGINQTNQINISKNSFQGTQIDSLTNEEIIKAYDKNGTLIINQTSSKVLSNNQFLVKFSRDLYWKENLVAIYIPDYKRIDPEEEFLKEKNSDNDSDSESEQTSTEPDSSAESQENISNCDNQQENSDEKCTEKDASNGSKDGSTNDQEDKAPENSEQKADSKKEQGIGNLRRLSSSLLEQLVVLKVIDSNEREVPSIIIKEKKVTNVTRNSMEIQVEFENPSLIQKNYRMQIQLNFSSFEKNWNDNTSFYFDLTPIKVTAQDKKSISKSIFQAGASIGTMIFTTIMIGSLSQLWGLVNGLQLIVHLPLILKSTFPDQTQTVLDFMIQIAQFDLIDSKAWIFQGIFQIYIPEDHEVYANLSRVKYDYEYTVLNLGTLFLLFVLFLIEAILLWFLKPIVNYWPRFKPIHDRLRKSLYWNQFLRLILEASIEISVSLINNISVEYNAYQNGDGIRWLPQSNFYWINTFTAAGCLVILIAGPIFIIIFYLRRFNDWESEAFETKFGSPLEGLRKDQKSSIFYPAFFIVRRTIFAFTCIIMSDYFAFQLIIIVELTLLQVCYLLYFRPFTCKKTQKLEVMNEVFNLILIYHVYALNTEWVENEYTQEAIGWSFIFFLIVALVIHLFFFLKQILNNKEETTFKKGTKANKFCIRIWLPCSKRIRTQHNLFAKQKKMYKDKQEEKKIKEFLEQIEEDAEGQIEQQLKGSAEYQVEHPKIMNTQLPSIKELSEIEEQSQNNKQSSRDKAYSSRVTHIRKGRVSQRGYSLEIDQNVDLKNNKVIFTGKKQTEFQDFENYNQNDQVKQQFKEQEALGRIYEVGMTAQKLSDLVEMTKQSQVKNKTN